MQCVKFGTRRLLARNGVHNEDAHRVDCPKRILVFKTAGRKRELVLHFRALARVRIHEAVAARDKNLGNVVAGNVHKERVAHESRNRRTAGYLHREARNREARTVERIHQVVAQEYDFGVAVTVDVANRNAGGFVREATCACSTALVTFGPERFQFHFAHDVCSHRTATAHHDYIVRSIAVQISACNFPLFAGCAIQFLPIFFINKIFGRHNSKGESIIRS